MPRSAPPRQRELEHWRSELIRNIESDLEWRHRDLSVRCVLLGARLSPRPLIVHDESGRLFLGAALQPSPPLRRPSLILHQVQRRVKRNPPSPVTVVAPWLRRSPAEMAPFLTGDNRVYPNRAPTPRLRRPSRPCDSPRSHPNAPKTVNVPSHRSSRPFACECLRNRCSVNFPAIQTVVLPTQPVEDPGCGPNRPPATTRAIGGLPNTPTPYRARSG